MLALLLIAGLPAPASAAPASATPRTPPGGGTVTLITGDRVTLMPAGRSMGVRIEPAPGRERMVFHRRESGGHAVVIPDDALPALASKQLDTGLFDVSDLIAQGYDDARRPDRGRGWQRIPRAVDRFSGCGRRRARRGKRDRWLVQPAGGQPGQLVSLRVTAEDTDDNSVDQTVKNAYQVR